MIDDTLDVIYCPFYETDVSVWSEMIEKLGTFPLFVLMAISNDPDDSKNIENLVRATALKLSTVLETVNDLVDNGLVIRNADASLELTYLGQQYVRINNYLENYSPSCKVAVNAFTGIVEEVKNEGCYTCEETPKSDMTLPIRINRLLIKNHDFSNIKSFMKNKIDLLNLSITEDDYEYIFFDLKPKKTFYVPYVVIKSTITNENPDSEHQIELVIPIEKVKKIITHPEIEKRQMIIKQLIDISDFEDNLLSDEGKYLLKILRKINEQNSKQPVYYECYTGTKIKFEPVAYVVKNKNIPRFKLTKRKKYRNDTYSKNDFIITNDISQIEISRLISFNDLVQME